MLSHALIQSFVHVDLFNYSLLHMNSKRKPRNSLYTTEFLHEFAIVNSYVCFSNNLYDLLYLLDGRTDNSTHGRTD